MYIVCGRCDHRFRIMGGIEDLYMSGRFLQKDTELFFSQLDAFNFPGVDHRI